MTKKIVALVLALVMCLSVVAIASAEQDDEGPAYRQAVKIVNTANAQILALVRIAQSTPYDDTVWLVAATTAISVSAKLQVASLGLKADCTYTAYEVDGKTVMIDPLYVVNPLPKSKTDADSSGK